MDNKELIKLIGPMFGFEDMGGFSIQIKTKNTYEFKFYGDVDSVHVIGMLESHQAILRSDIIGEHINVKKQ